MKPTSDVRGRPADSGHVLVIGASLMALNQTGVHRAAVILSPSGYETSVTATKSQLAPS
jgi:hypothetical protein